MCKEPKNKRWLGSATLPAHSQQETQASKEDSYPPGSMDKTEGYNTIFYSRHSHGQGKIPRPETGKAKKGAERLNSVLATALKDRDTDVKSLNPDPFKCGHCTYTCKRKVTLEKHKNTKHGQRSAE